MNNLSEELTNYILKKGIIQKEYYEIYQFGFQCFLEILGSIICSIIIAVYLKMEVECIIFFFFFIPLRSYSGGLHMNKYFTCLFVSSITLATILIIVKYWSVSTLTALVLYFISLLLIKIIGPVNHPNREVDEEENVRFVAKTNNVLLISIAATFLFLFANTYRYVFLEALVFSLVAITTLIAKLKSKT